MSIATLKEDLVRELAVAALGEEPVVRWNPLSGGSDLINWQTDPRELVAAVRGPELIVAHVHDGSRIWIAPGTLFRQTGGNASVVLTDVTQWLNDHVGVSRLCIHKDLPGKFDTGPMPLFPNPTHVSVFCQNVLDGHVQDA